MCREHETLQHYLEQIVLSEDRAWNQAARALHDASMQELADAQLQLESLKLDLAGQANAQAQVEAIQGAVRQANQGLRYLFSEMTSDMIERQGLGSALFDFAHSLRQRYPGHAKITLSAGTYQEECLEGRAKLVLYRCLQRFLVETVLASRAESISVSLAQEDGHVVGRIQSDGALALPGVEAWQGRLASVGGELTLQTGPESSPVIAISVPARIG